MRSILLGIALSVFLFLAFGPRIGDGITHLAPGGMMGQGSDAPLSSRGPGGGWWPFARETGQAANPRGPWPDSVLDWPGFGAVDECRPTARNPRYSCIPVWAPLGRVPSIAQLGAGLPAEWDGLPPLSETGGGR